ncbi:E3 UFM1-protein ligase 1 [Haplosporangium sp. Z 27]|nr:E3 UFM1-protein ligase 1 [Haplosporangium sp. Z 27]
MTTIWNSLFGISENQKDLESPPNLSEDACGDLVHSLIRLGYLSNIIPSLDGKSFITHEQLTKDIVIQLENRNGRISLLDMPKTLNADLSDIQDRVHDLIRSKPGTIVQVQDELLKVEYLDRMTAIMKEELIKKGYLTTMDQCRQYKLDIDYMRQFLKDRVGSIIPGQWDTIDRGLVIEPRFLEKEKTALLKALNDLHEPTSLQFLRSRHIVQDQLFYGLCDLLSKDSVELPGLFRGTNDQGAFEPYSYGHQQTEWIETFFKDNGFIELDSIKKRGVSDPKTYLQLNHPTALILEAHAIKESIWSIVDATVEDTIANLSWIDVKPLLPTPLTKGDISSLLRQLPSLVEPTSRIAISPDQDHSLTGLGGGSPQEAFVIQDSIVVTSGQIQKCLLRMGPLLDRSLKALVSWRLSFGESEQLENDGDFDDGDEDIDVFEERGASLKDFMEHILDSAHNQQRKLSRSNPLQSTNKIKKKKGGKQIQDFLSMQDLKKEIKQLEPEFDSALVNATAGAIYKSLVQNLRDRNRSVILNQMQEDEGEDQGRNDGQAPESEQIEKEKQEIKHLPSAIRSLAKRIELSSKGIDVFEDASVKNSLSKYLLQSWCVELLNLAVLHLASVDHTPSTLSKDTLSEALETKERLYKSYTEHCNQTKDALSGQGPFTISIEDSTILLNMIPQDAKDRFKKLFKLTAGSCKQKSLVEYLDIWSTLLKDPKLELNTFGEDRKNDSQVLTEHLNELRQILAGIQPFMDTALMLHIVALIAFQKWTGTMLHASGKFVPRILRQLRQSAEQQPELKQTVEAQLVSLEKMMDSVLSNVKQQHQQSDENERSNEQQNANQLWQSVYDIGSLLSV